MIALEGDVANVRFGKKRHPAELTLGDAVVEILAAQDIIEILHAVNLMHALFGRDEQTDVVPLTDGFGSVKRLACIGVNRRLVECIQPSAPNGVARLDIILKLKFGAGRPGVVGVIRDVEHYATVAGLGDVVVDFQFEPAVLVIGAQVARVVRVGTNKCAVLNLPAGADVLAFEVVPAGKVIAVKQELPAGGFFLFGEGVGLRDIVGVRGFDLGVRDQCEHQNSESSDDKYGAKFNTILLSIVRDFI